MKVKKPGSMLGWGLILALAVNLSYMDSGGQSRRSSWKTSRA